jgi:hypothetical protein
MMADLIGQFSVSSWTDGKVVVRASRNAGYETLFERAIEYDKATRLADAIDTVLTPSTHCVLTDIVNPAIAARKQERARLQDIIDQATARLQELEEL